jgi:hypothetical protein
MAAQRRQTIGCSVSGPVARSQVAILPDLLAGVLCRRPAREVVCDVREARPDAVTVELLARMRCSARRSGCRLRLRNASPELLELIALMGLGEALGD